MVLRIHRWPCRLPAKGDKVKGEAISRLPMGIADAGFDAVRTGNPYSNDILRGDPQAQGGWRHALP